MAISEEKFNEILHKAQEIHHRSPEEEEQFLLTFANEKFTEIQTIAFQIELAYSRLAQSRTNEALSIYTEMHKKAQRYGSQEYMADALEGIGNCQVDSGDLNEAEKNLKNAIALYSLCKLPEKKSKACNTLAVLYYMKGEYDQAIPWYDRSRNLTENKTSIRYVAAIGNSGLIYHSRGEMEKAAELYSQAVAISEQKNYTVSCIVFRENLGDVLRELGKFTEAQENFEKALVLAHKLKDKKHIATVSTTYAHYWIERGFFDESYIYLENALRILEEIHYTFGLVNFYYVYARFWVSKGAFLKSIEALKKCLQFMEESGVKESKCDILTLFAEIYEVLGNTEMAYKSLIEAEEFSHIRNSPVEHGGVLIERAKLNIKHKNYYESLMLLNEAKWIAEKCGDFDQKFLIELLFTQATISICQNSSEKSSWFKKADNHLSAALQLAKNHNLIPKSLHVETIHGLFKLLKGQVKEATSILQETLILAEKFNMNALARKCRDIIKFILQSPFINISEEFFHKFIHDIILEEIHNLTSLFIQYVIKPMDVDQSYILAYNIDQSLQVSIHAADNLDQNQITPTRESQLMKTIYSIISTQHNPYPENLYGPFPYGAKLSRAVLFTKNIQSSPKNQPDVMQNQYIMIIFIFNKIMSPLFYNFSKLYSFFGDKMKSIHTMNDITEEFLHLLRKSVFSEFLVGFPTSDSVRME